MGRKGSPRSPQAEGGSRAASPPSPLWALPEELLLLICSYLDAQALGRLAQVCRRLRFLSGRDVLWRRIARGCLNSGFTQLGTDLCLQTLRFRGFRLGELGAQGDEQSCCVQLGWILYPHMPSALLSSDPYRGLENTSEKKLQDAGLYLSSFLMQACADPAENSSPSPSCWHSSEGKGEGVSELEARTLQEGDSPEMEMQASSFFLFFFAILMPWMELDGEYLYLSQAENIHAYHFCAEGTGLQRHPQAIFSGHQEDVCRFVLVNSHIVSGGGDGSIVLHKIHGSYSVKFSAHEQEVNCVDFQGGLIVSGSRDRTAKVWSLSTGRVGQCLHTVQTEDRVWSIAISPLLRDQGKLECSGPIQMYKVRQTQEFLLAYQCTIVITVLLFFSDLSGGQRPDKLYQRFKEKQKWSAKHTSIPAFGVQQRSVVNVYGEAQCVSLSSELNLTGTRTTKTHRVPELESGQLLTCLGTDFHRGAGVLDVFYETPSLLLSCGYDTYIRYWDIRTSTRKCVQEWEEPHDSALYCIRSDKNHMIASGSSYYGVVRLWDKRQTRCLQSFHLSSPTSSPVYCLRFSTTHLYAALASALHVLDFTAS
ncbi:hypothetical protein DUI87_11584 [Hirundo rustica rustica]|uniref:F-box domain-containing protein n=1 Tax=Hirundo rustica rustica TaxID=333673 RepID=A0A3M0KEL3_HIRRU|nr:hypothetical protein DUI87_11584 [Hirundo rustica rustica]